MYAVRLPDASDCIEPRIKCGGGTGIMAVTMPLSVYELVNTLEMMLQSAARRRKKERAKPKVRSAEEQHIIDRAKAF